MSNPKIYIRTFGCQMNVADSERISKEFCGLGYELANSPENADIILFNTCAVRENAENRVFGHLGYVKRYKDANKNVAIGICGCMANEQTILDKLALHYPYVTFTFGPERIPEIPEILQAAGVNLPNCEKDEYMGITSAKIRNSRKFVPIMYGCDNFCTYCIVPYVRGRERSRDPKVIIGEVKKLVENGCKEITLLGQNVNSYGKGLMSENGETWTFPKLLRELNEIDGFFWIRFMTSHPKDASKELFDAMSECEKVVKHIHLPLQSGSDEVLARMNRQYTVDEYLKKVEYARAKIPQISFTTDIIVGFPNETENDFSQTLDIIEKIGYNNIFGFVYSKREGTSAANLPDKTSYREKTERVSRLLELQRKKSEENNVKLIGTTIRALTDEHDASKNHKPKAVTKGMVIVELDREMPVGEFVNVKITGAKSAYLIGEIA